MIDRRQVSLWVERGAFHMRADERHRLVIQSVGVSRLGRHDSAARVVGNQGDTVTHLMQKSLLVVGTQRRRAPINLDSDGNRSPGGGLEQGGCAALKYHLRRVRRVLPPNVVREHDRSPALLDLQVNSRSGVPPVETARRERLQLLAGGEAPNRCTRAVLLRASNSIPRRASTRQHQHERPPVYHPLSLTTGGERARGPNRYNPEGNVGEYDANQ